MAPGGRNQPFAELLPAPTGHNPSSLRCLAMDPLLLDRGRVIDVRHGGVVVENQGALASQGIVVANQVARALPHHAFVHRFFRPQVPEAADEPVVRTTVVAHCVVDEDLAVEFVVEITVLSEHLPKLNMLVGPADLLTHDPARIMQQSRVVTVVMSPLDQEAKPFFHPVISVSIVVELDRHVVRQIVRLELPDHDVVGLKLGDLLRCGREVVPFFLLLVLECLLPQQIRRNASHPKGCQFHRFTGRIDFSQVGLSQAVLLAQLRQHAAAAVASRGRSADVVQRKQQQSDRCHIDDFAPERDALGHPATSRDFKKK